MNEETIKSVGEKVILGEDFDSAYSHTVAALKTEGFGVITEVDMQETFKKKLGAEFPPYKILGACNPSLSFRALNAVPEVGLLLPCNVTLRQLEDGRVEVALIDPFAMLGVLASDDLQPVAEEASARLKRVRAALEKGDF